MCILNSIKNENYKHIDVYLFFLVPKVPFQNRIVKILPLCVTDMRKQKPIKEDFKYTQCNSIKGYSVNISLKFRCLRALGLAPVSVLDVKSMIKS